MGLAAGAGSLSLAPRRARALGHHVNGGAGDS